MLMNRERQGERIGKRGVEIDMNGKYIGVGTISLTLYKRAKKRAMTINNVVDIS